MNRSKPAASVTRSRARRPVAVIADLGVARAMTLHEIGKATTAELDRRAETERDSATLQAIAAELAARLYPAGAR